MAVLAFAFCMQTVNKRASQASDIYPAVHSGSAETMAFRSLGNRTCLKGFQGYFLDWSPWWTTPTCRPCFRCQSCPKQVWA